jgi:hypothetical protein
LYREPRIAYDDAFQCAQSFGGGVMPGRDQTIST